MLGGFEQALASLVEKSLKKFAEILDNKKLQIRCNFLQQLSSQVAMKCVWTAP